ncbi:Organellar oligopeptidase A, chloroplastic/mitochondrial [Morella rubra]|uniref:oligopeptidase A n=1 Tax=Morella rubra TaxID=262757 RepID=A0A6A1UND0_9ROSI|nr:Organellar oligopeptidase A, chloroplastic/mitochondrial [Morella rubra]
MAAATALDEPLGVNPLTQDFEFPPFDVVDAKHVRPGIRALLKKLEDDLVELERSVEPSWPKLVEPLEKIVDRLTVVWGIVNHLKSVKDSPELRSAIEEVQPEKVKFQLRLGQSKPLYNSFKAIQESPDWQSLSDARKRIVESQIKEAILNGVSLEDDKRDQFNKIEQELERLSQKFEENVLDATKKFEKLITDKKEIEGLPATALGLAAQTAVSKGYETATAENGPWIITLDAPSFMSVMQHSRNRSLREEVYRAYITRASSEDLDNTLIIDQVLKLRLEKAKLLGYHNYAEVSMATKMATVERAEELLEKLRSASWNPAVQAQIKEAILNGVSLEDDKRDQFNKIEQELERLSQKFEENVLDATKKFEKLITDKKEIEGLPATALGLAAQTAVSKGYETATAENGPWIITLDAPSFMSVMQHSRNRSLREEVYRAYITRASSEDLDNTLIIDQVLKLRLEKAKLLGYHNYAEVSMATKMATVERAEELLEKLRSASWNPAVQDMDDVKNFAKNQGALEADELNHWDINFWSERLRESKFDINEEELRPFFSLPKVMDGLFNLAKRLFGIIIEPADGLAPVWNHDVKFYCVKDTSGSPIAYFYFDPYSRPSEKRGGAWMDEVIGRSRVLSRDGTSARLPVAHMVCNQTPPVGDKPSLMTFREVETVFHEFGHALQHMLTKQDEGLVSGIRGIEWDAVELPSQFMENWCYHRDTLMSIAKHYETGESLPEEVYLKLLAARTFRAGSQSLRQIRFASLDLQLHTKYVPGGSESIYDIDQRVAERTQVIPPLSEDRFLCGFSHIFAGGYAAGYYSYKVLSVVWAEVLSADAFSAFEDAGLDNREAVIETGHKFRETILALGGGKAPLEVFVEFRGREPSPEALLRHNGLLPVSAS